MIRKRNPPEHRAMTSGIDHSLVKTAIPSAPGYHWIHHSGIHWYYLCQNTPSGTTILWHTNERETQLPVIGIMNIQDPYGWYYDAEDIDSIVPYLLSLIRLGLHRQED